MMKNNEKKKLILFDIDGTLFDNKNKVVPESTIKALNLLKDKAIIGIATGRAGFMLHSIDVVRDLFDYFVFINGQYIVAKDKVVFEDPINIDHLKSIVFDMDELGIAYGFQSSVQEAINKIDDNVIASFKNLDLALPRLNKDYYLQTGIYQCWVFAEKPIIDILSAKHPEFQFVKWMDVGYDILPVKASKGLGVKRLAEHLGIDLKDVIAIGDGFNDIEMLEMAGLGIAMGNAHDNVKKHADYVTTNVDDDGIYNALKHFNLI